MISSLRQEDFVVEKVTWAVAPRLTGWSQFNCGGFAKIPCAVLNVTNKKVKPLVAFSKDKEQTKQINKKHKIK
jgi:hypothetical protein